MQNLWEFDVTSFLLKLVSSEQKSCEFDARGSRPPLCHLNYTGQQQALRRHDRRPKPELPHLFGDLFMLLSTGVNVLRAIHHKIIAVNPAFHAAMLDRTPLIQTASNDRDTAPFR
jgi:hypothetical protein